MFFGNGGAAVSPDGGAEVIDWDEARNDRRRGDARGAVEVAPDFFEEALEEQKVEEGEAATP